MKSVAVSNFKRNRAWYTGLLLVSLLVGALVNDLSGGAPLLWLAGNTRGLFWPCPLNFLTDVICPTCGLGRALILAWTGHWGLSWQYHPGGVLLLGAAGALAIGLWWRGPAVWQPFHRGRAWLNHHPWTGLAVIALYCLWGFGRQLPL